MATAYKITEQDDERGDKRQRDLLEAARPIIGRLSQLADDQVRAKGMIEVRWLEDLQQYYGRYDAAMEAELIEEGRSTVFVKLTRHKTNSWSARLGDLLFPTDSKNWGVEPTPVPTLERQAKEAVEKALSAVEAANETDDPQQQARILESANDFATAARRRRGEITEAKKRCMMMETVIDDQLVESDFVTQARDVIEDGCKLGTGILKGPLTSQRLRAQWKEQDGVWQLANDPNPLPEYRRVDPWHFFPDMSAIRISEAEFTFERHLPTRKDLKRLARKFGFNREAVARILEEGPRPVTAEVDHLAQLRAITGEGDPITERYVMWEYHGALECEEVAMLLRAAGQEKKAESFEEEKDPLEDYRVIIHFCNDEVLKIAPEYPLDSGESLYSVWNFEKGETTVFGLGVPAIMADSQRMVNGANRMIMDNAGLSAAPQILINRNAVQPQDGVYSIKPFKVWLMSSTAGVTPQVPAFQTFNIETNTEQLISIIELAKIFIDEETGMPQIAQGEQGEASKTLGGMSMLFNSANVVFRRIVKSWDDDLTKPTIRRAYDWNMQFNPDQNIKGDMQVDARGTSVLLVREIQSQTLMNIMTNWTTHPLIGPWMLAKQGGIRSALEKTLQTMMIPVDDMLATQDEYDEYQRKQAEAAAQEGEGGDSPEAIRLLIAREQAAAAKEIEMIRREVALIKAEQETGLKREEIAQRAGIEMEKVAATERTKQAELGSKERLKAADIAVEDRRAKEAKAQGEPASAATGKGVG